MKQLWVATGNLGKLSEIKSLFHNQAVEIHSQKDLPVFSPPIENGDSFLANARIKARALKSLKKDVWICGEDSGLEVYGLNNLPGIHSARYAGDHAADAENTAKLLKMVSIRTALKREAQFRAVLVAIDPLGQEHIFEGILKGTISKSQKGTEGFGYDNVFIPEGQTLTLAELGTIYKNQHSHRAQVIKKLLPLVLTT